MADTACDDSWMTPGQVATLFRVDPRTVRTRRWDQILAEAISRTLGGHRRYSAPEVRAILHAASAVQPPAPGPASAVAGMRTGPGPMTTPETAGPDGAKVTRPPSGPAEGVRS